MDTLEHTSLDPAQRRVLERFVAALEAELGDDLVAVWLFGSRARGEPPHPESDLDLMIVTRHGHDEWRRVYQLLSGIADEEETSPVYFSLKLVDPEWVRDRRAIRSFFIQEVDRDKLVLAGAP